LIQAQLRVQRLRPTIICCSSPRIARWRAESAGARAAPSHRLFPPSPVHRFISVDARTSAEINERFW